jgi:hypothetical protein
MAYKMNGFKGFKTSPAKFKIDGGIPKGTSTTKRARIGKASKFLQQLKGSTLGKDISKPVVKNVAKGLKTFSRAFPMVGGFATIAPYVVKGAKAVMPGLKKRAKKELKGGSMYTSSKI